MPGSVTYSACFKRPAPSMRAAYYSSASTEASDAR
jgi:hypothetical protein